MRAAAAIFALVFAAALVCGCTEPAPRGHAAAKVPATAPTPPAKPLAPPLPGQLAPRIATAPNAPPPTPKAQPPHPLPNEPGGHRAADPALLAAAQGQVVDRRRDTPDRLIRRIVNVAANHNLPGLKRFMSTEFSAKVDKMVADHGARFWRHVDKYADAAANGFTMTERPGSDGKRKLLRLKTREGAVLNPIVVRQRGGWVFERL